MPKPDSSKPGTTEPDPTERQDSTTLRVATWNIWWRFGPWEERQPKILDTLRLADADIVTLQETWPAQAQRIADELGLHFCSYSGKRPPADEPDRGFGNAILSRWPSTEIGEQPLSALEGPAHRSIAFARIDSPFGPLPIFTTHLAYRYDESEVRQLQLREACEFVAEHLEEDAIFPPVLTGDLNAVADSDEIRMMTGRSKPYVPGLIWTDLWEQLGADPGITWCDKNPYVVNSAWPNRRIDYVLVGWPRPRPVGNPVGVSLIGVDDPGSDHYGVVADLVAVPPVAEPSVKGAVAEGE